MKRTIILTLLLSLFLMATAHAQTVVYYHTDALGTPVAVTDASGSVVERSEYEPYGSLLNRPLTDGPGYTGHVMDAATGLTYMQQRYYDPGIGWFLSADPVTASDSNGSNFNRYWYANNNPYKFTDPDGRESGAAFKVVNDATNGGPVAAPQRSPDDWLGPAIGVSLAVVAAPAMAFGGFELGMVALANPVTTTAVAVGTMEAVAGTSLGANSALSRAKDVQAVLNPRTQRAVTTAVAETEQGIRVFGSSEGALRPAQRAALQAGEVAAKGARGTHAEINAVNGARAQGLTPTSVSPSRPACPSCQDAMRAQNIPIKDK